LFFFFSAIQSGLPDIQPTTNPVISQFSFTYIASFMAAPAQTHESDKFKLMSLLVYCALQNPREAAAVFFRRHTRPRRFSRIFFSRKRSGLFVLSFLPSF
jgi:hypothetical protein